MKSMKFSELGLAEPFLRAAKDAGYESATPIQSEAIPVVLVGGDLIGCAQTGTGKTAAYTLPMLDRLTQTLPPRATKGTDRKSQRTTKGSRPRPRRLRALVLAPTRELAAQIGEGLNRYGQFTPLRHTVVYGGVSQHHQVKALRHGVDTLVATPGRLLDLMDQGYIDLSNIEILVLDEADQMLDMGFLPALKRVVKAVPAKRQTLMFSATMPDEIRRLAQRWLNNPVSIQIGLAARPVEQIAQSVFMVDKRRKPELLTMFLQETPRGRTLVFSRTKHGADKIVRRLNKDGVYAAAIHGNKSQAARSRVLLQFKSKMPPVLVATDIAARGLDVDEVSHVVNYDLPQTPETYIHRVGRTARAGAEGVAVSFCASDERQLLRQIEHLTKGRIRIEPTVEGFEPTEPLAATKRKGESPRHPKPRASRKPQLPDGGRDSDALVGSESSGKKNNRVRRRKNGKPLGATARGRTSGRRRRRAAAT